MESIQYQNRHTGTLETEKVYGESFLRWAYGNPLGPLALNTFIKKPFFSAWYGKRMSTPESKSRVAPFIQEYQLDPADFADAPDSYGSFNEFFYRKLKPEARPIDRDANSVVFPADGRHLGFQKASEIEGVFVKGQKFDLPALQLSVKARTGLGQWIGEAIATFGLILTILGTVRFRPQSVPASVGLYITAAYWFTSSTSFANPAITIARSLSDTFAGIAPRDVPLFIVAQLIGAAVAALLARWLFEESNKSREQIP